MHCTIICCINKLSVSWEFKTWKVRFSRQKKWSICLCFCLVFRPPSWKLSSKLHLLNVMKGTLKSWTQPSNPYTFEDPYHRPQVARQRQGFRSQPLHALEVRDKQPSDILLLSLKFSICQLILIWKRLGLNCLKANLTQLPWNNDIFQFCKIYQHPIDAAPWQLFKLFLATCVPFENCGVATSWFLFHVRAIVKLLLWWISTIWMICCLWNVMI